MELIVLLHSPEHTTGAQHADPLAQPAREVALHGVVPAVPSGYVRPTDGAVVDRVRGVRHASGAKLVSW